jgi:prephenate dehydrogenase
MRGVEVIGLTRSPEKARDAENRGVVDWGTVHPREALRSADTVVIATPVSAVPHWIAEAERWVPEGTLVTDMGSAKQAIVVWADRQRFRKVRFVGAHPMAGSHESGIESARPDLFDGSFTFVTRGPHTTPSALKAAISFWRRIGERVVVIRPAEHDRIVAETSHLPHLLATLLIRGASRRYLPYAATGFMDTTRIAQGDPKLWVDIMLANRSFLLKLLGKHRRLLEGMIHLLESRNRSLLEAWLKQAAEIRKKLSPKG